MSKFYQVDFPPEIMARGFWLYVWKIFGPNNAQFCYVGMTGDVTGVAQSPFNRASNHFGSNPNANAIKRHLASRNIEPTDCKLFTYFAYGPVLPYFHSKPRHKDFDNSRKKVGCLERKLFEAAQNAGYTMLNERPRFGPDHDERLWGDVREAFEAHLNLSKDPTGAQK